MMTLARQGPTAIRQRHPHRVELLLDRYIDSVWWPALIAVGTLALMAMIMFTVSDTHPGWLISMSIHCISLFAYLLSMLLNLVRRKPKVALVKLFLFVLLAALTTLVLAWAIAWIIVKNG